VRVADEPHREQAGEQTDRDVDEERSGATHASADCEKPRSALIDGSATLTIVESRMIVSIPTHSTTRASQRVVAS
jgi:hypothetical protein